jgi:hypothetical protein
MMPQIRGSKGQMVNAKQITFEQVSEGFSVYKLSDGKIMKIKVVLAEVYSLDELDDLGRNNYFIKSQPVISIEESKEIKK